MISRKQQQAIFAKNKNKRREGSFATRHPLLTGFAASIPASIAQAGVGLGAVSHINKQSSSPSDVAKLIKTVRRLHPQVRSTRFSSTRKYSPLGAKLGGYAYIPSQARQKVEGLLSHPRLGFRSSQSTRPLIISKTTPAAEFAAHEFGHAASLSKKNFIGKLNRAIVPPSHMISKLGVAGTVSLLAQPVISKLPISEEKKRKARIGAAALPAITSAPMIYDEARANIRAFKYLKQSGLPIRRALKTLPLAFSTYPMLAASTIIPGAIAAHYYNKRRQKQMVKRVNK